ncbi:MAG: hypothetical protein ACE5JX_18930 [Acidobacteriota bacterium]
MESFVKETSIPEKIDQEQRLAAEAQTAVVSSDAYLKAHGETLTRTLDLDTWQPGTDLMQLYARLEQEVTDAVLKEHQYQKQIRQQIFPRLRSRAGAPKGAGVYRVPPDRLREVHLKLLFNGAVEACDGNVVSHDTLPVTITQIGVCLVSYHGDQGSWVHRLYRRDLRAAGEDPVDETMKILEARRRRGAQDPSARDKMSTLARRAIMAYAERAVLLDRSNAVWRVGHGSPTPYELITGSGIPDLLRESLRLLRRLIDHEKFLFVPSSTSARELLTIGNALLPLEYAIVDTNQANLGRIAAGHYRGQEWGSLGHDVDRFVSQYGHKIVIGLYRASEQAPARMFYAHVNYAHEAALIALADSVLQEHRGFPMLIDLADNLCTAAFGAEIFSASAQVAYTRAGAPFRYMAERGTRR